MANKKRTKPIILRVEPETHLRIEQVASALHISVNALLNMLVQRFLGQVQVEARVFEEVWTRSREAHELLKKWKVDHPRTKQAEFFPEFIKYLMEERSELDDYGPRPRSMRLKLPDIDAPTKQPGDSI